MHTSYVYEHSARFCAFRRKAWGSKGSVLFAGTWLVAFLVSLAFPTELQADTFELVCTSPTTSSSCNVINTESRFTDTIHAVGLQVGDIVRCSTTNIRPAHTNISITG